MANCDSPGGIVEPGQAEVVAVLFGLEVRRQPGEVARPGFHIAVRGIP